MLMNENTVAALLDWSEIMKLSIPEFERLLRQRYELEREYEHVDTKLKQVNREHAAKLDLKIIGLVNLFSEELEVHRARFTL